MNTLFIDIDGVLITDWSLNQPLMHVDDTTSFEPLSPDGVAALNMILNEFRPLQVIHSTRRYFYTAESFRDVWKMNGIKHYDNMIILESYAHLDDMWFDGPRPEKEYDLKSYIMLNDLGDGDYAVLEDAPLAVDNLYLVEAETGLTTDHAHRIINDFSRPQAVN